MCSVTHTLFVIGQDFKKMWNDSNSLSVGLGTSVMWLPFSKNVQWHSLSVGHRIRHYETGIQNDVQCCSLPVGHITRSDEAAFRKMCNVAHFLFKIISQDMRRLHLEDFAMLLTSCWSYVSQELMKPHSEKGPMSLTFCWLRAGCHEAPMMCSICNSLSVGHETGWEGFETTIQQNVKHHSPSVGHKAGCLEASKMSNITYSLSGS